MRAGQQLTQWHVSPWFNAVQPLEPRDLRGRIVMLHAFQMLCPGCVSHGLPQALRVRALFPEQDVAVIGLHTVFENHEAMQPHALAAFIREYRLKFPIGVDEPDPGNPIPKTMQQLGLQGTPSVVLLDRDGRLRLNRFGMVEDLQLGAMIGQLLNESNTPMRATAETSERDGCTEQSCAVPTGR
jgi:hypothetical protein